MNVSAIGGQLGGIDPSRFMNRMQRMQNADPSEFASRMIENRDTDGDGALSIGETNLSEEMFAEIDTDGDGLHSQGEIQAAMEERTASMPPPGGPGGPRGMGSPDEFAADLIGRLDADGDGALSIEETNLSEEMFGEIDTDGDGLHSQEEIQEAMAARKESMGAMRGGMESTLLSELGSSKGDVSTLLDVLNQSQGQSAYEESNILSSLLTGDGAQLSWFGTDIANGLSLSA